MDTIPARSIVAKPYRIILEKLEGYLIFPVKNPNAYTILSVIFSIPFLLVQNVLIRLVLLVLVLLFDWMDGAAARKFNRASHAGYVIDIVCDRLSEGIIFASILGMNYGKILFFLYLVNNILTFYSIKTRKHYLLAIRFLYVLILLAQLVNQSLFI